MASKSTFQSADVQSRTRRKLLVQAGGLGVAIFAAPLIAACAPAATPSGSTGLPGGQGTPAATTAPIRGGTLTDIDNVEPRSLNPILADSSQSYSGPNSAMFDGLLMYMPDGSLGPLLARSLPTVSPDGKTYKFELDKAAKWTDGKPVSADDVVFTYRVMYHPDYKDVPSQFRAELSSLVDDVRAVDQSTVEIVTKTAYAPFLTNHSTYPIVPKHVLGSVPPKDFAAHPFGKSPTVSSGPFKFQEWVAGSHVVFARNADYWRGAPNIERYVRKFVPNDAAVGLLLSGQVDIGSLYEFKRFAELKSSSSLEVDSLASPLGPRIWFNLDPGAPAAAIFSSKAVRQAMLYAADRPGSINAVLGGSGALPTSTGMFPTYSWANKANAEPGYKTDRAKAAQLLDADGWRLGPNGIREKNGRPLKFSLSTSGDNTDWQKIATILQQDWKAVGAEVTVLTPAFAQLTQQALNREFDVMMQSSPYRTADPDPSAGYHSRNAVKGTGRNFSSYKNPTLDKLLEDAAATVDQTKRKQLYDQAQDIVNEDVPSFSTAFWGIAWIRNKRVRNLGLDRVGPYNVYLRNHWKDAFVADGK